MRPLSNSERHAVEKFSIKLRDDIRAQIMQDLNAASVHWESGDGSRILFAIDGYIRPQYRSQQTYGIDGKMTDKDGADLTVCLYADENNRILELEVIRWDEKPLIDPQWDCLEIFG